MKEYLKFYWIVRKRNPSYLLANIWDESIVLMQHVLCAILKELEQSIRVHSTPENSQIFQLTCFNIFYIHVSIFYIHYYIYYYLYSIYMYIFEAINLWNISSSSSFLMDQRIDQTFCWISWMEAQFRYQNPDVIYMTKPQIYLDVMRDCKYESVDWMSLLFVSPFAELKECKSDSLV